MRLILVAGGIAMLITLFGTPLLIRVLRAYGYSPAIRESGEFQYPDHEKKRGTPSMGGVAIVVAVLLGYTGAHLYRWAPPSVSAVLVLFLMTGLAAVGMADDYIKIFKRRSVGLRASTKFGGQVIVGIIFAVLAVHFKDANGLTPASFAISDVRDTFVVLPLGLLIIWVLFIITASANAVNLTDGLDGLAAGAAVMSFAGYTLIGVWQFGNTCLVNHTDKCYQVRDPLDLAVVAAATMGATFGFLWWNAAPAQIFMGDTGSLALGGALAGLAILSRTELLLVLIGGLFVIITMSVIIQVVGFRFTGKRIFRMAPLQHHFEMRGWAEITIVVRFWIIAGLCVGAAMALFYAQWVK